MIWEVGGEICRLPASIENREHPTPTFAAA